MELQEISLSAIQKAYQSLFPLAILDAIETDYAETNIPYKLDLTDYHRAGKEFQELINRVAVNW